MTEHKDRLATVGTVRIYTVLGFAFLFLLLTGANIVSVNNDRTRCNIANDARVSELHQRETLITVNVGRVLAASSPDERRANMVALTLYRGNLVELIDSQRPVAINPGVQVPAPTELLDSVTSADPFDIDTDAVVADCSETHPYPPLVSWFD